jgi:GNAT superfamily N-acetyltransferase
MISLSKNRYSEIYKLYSTNAVFFPLIAAVLQDKQDGVIYVDNDTKPSQIYTEHSFGFAQIFGNPNTRFEQELEHYLLTDKSFSPDKIRLYTPYLPQFITLPQYESLRSYRQRFILDIECFKTQCLANNRMAQHIKFYAVDSTNTSTLCNEFGINSRFWRNTSDFALKSNAIIVSYNEEPASICYAAAEADKHLEIDVLTIPEYRNLGLAKLAVAQFIHRCLELSLSPLWDCFTNNIGSMMLCKSLGFTALREPYPFFTINK